MMARWPNKDCSGAHCHVHDACEHHALPVNGLADGLVYPSQPIYKREDCDWFKSNEPWGVGPETPDHD